MPPTPSSNQIYEAEIPKTVTIDTNNIGYYLVHSDAATILEQNSINICHDSHKIQLNLLHPALEFESVKHISLNKLKIRPYRLLGRFSSYNLFCDIKIEENKRILVISSSIVLRNSTIYNIGIRIENTNKSYIEFELEPKCSRGVPVDFLGGKIQFKIIELNTIYCEKKPLVEFFGDDDNLTERQCGEYYVMINSKKRDPKIEFYTLIIEPALEIKNCCALPLLYILSGSYNLESKSPLKLNTQQMQQEIHFSIDETIRLTIKVQNFSWSDEIIINDPKLKDNDVLPDHLELKDTMGQILNVCIYQHSSSTGSKVIYLYTKACLINETPWELYSYHVDKKKNSYLIPGQVSYNFVEETTEPINHQILLLNETYALALAINNQSKNISDEVGLGKVGNTYIEVIDKDDKGKIISIQEVGVSLSVQACGILINKK